jgi:hypothetical protein
MVSGGILLRVVGSRGGRGGGAKRVVEAVEIIRVRVQRGVAGRREGDA